jgi:carbon storage regulator
MLVLTRRAGEWITIGDGITVKVLSVKGDSVQLGVEAPREIPVHRGEIFEQIRSETEAAHRSASAPDALARLLRGKKAPKPDK